MSPSDVLYHGIPQVNANADTSQIVPEGDASADSIPTDFPPSIDARIQWVYFFLGAAFLLPWNGIFLILQPILKNSQS